MVKNIVLVGLMGCGKTTVGKLLASKLNMSFIDTDSQIEQHAGRSINQIFEKYGETHFRNLEHQIAIELSNKSGYVISTGGGFVENTDNINLLKDNSVLFYLLATPQELYDRIKDDTSRPLLKNSSPLETLKVLLDKRESKYRLADEMIITSNKPIDEIVKEITEKYSKYE